MSFYRKGADNQRIGTNNKTTVDKRIVARKVIDELNARIDSGVGLSDVSTDKLITFLQGSMPKEHNVTSDYNIQYISNVAKQQIEDKPLDITEHVTIIEDTEADQSPTEESVI